MTATYRIIRKSRGSGVFRTFVWRVWRYPEREAVAECASEGEMREVITPEDIERAVDEYVLNGDPAEIIGRKLSGRDCPVAKACVAILGVEWASTIFYTTTVPEFEIVSNTVRVRRFITLTDRSTDGLTRVYCQELLSRATA